MLCVCTGRVFVSLLYWSAKQCDWLSLAGPAPFPFPLFLFPVFYLLQWTRIRFDEVLLLEQCVLVDELDSVILEIIKGPGINLLIKHLHNLIIHKLVFTKLNKNTKYLNNCFAPLNSLLSELVFWRRREVWRLQSQTQAYFHATYRLDLPQYLEK